MTFSLWSMCLLSAGELASFWSKPACRSRPSRPSGTSRPRRAPRTPSVRGAAVGKHFADRWGEVLGRPTSIPHAASSPDHVVMASRLNCPISQSKTRFVHPIRAFRGRGWSDGGVARATTRKGWLSRERPKSWKRHAVSPAPGITPSSSSCRCPRGDLVARAGTLRSARHHVVVETAPPSGLRSFPLARIVVGMSVVPLWPAALSWRGAAG